VRLQISTAMKTHDEFIWVVAPCSDVVGYQSFGGPCCLNLKDGPPKRWLSYVTTRGHNPKQHDMNFLTLFSIT